MKTFFFDSSLLHTNIGAMASGEAIRSGQRLVAAAEAKIVIIGQATPLQAAALTVPGSRGHRTANAANRVPRVSEPTRIHQPAGPRTPIPTAGAAAAAKERIILTAVKVIMLTTAAKTLVQAATRIITQ